MGVHIDERSTRWCIHGDEQRSVNAFSLEHRPQAGAGIIIADAPHECRLGTHSCARNRLIETLAARMLGIARRDQCLTGTRKLLHRRNEIEVRASDDDDIELD